MLIILWVATILRQARYELTTIINGAIRRRVLLRDTPCARQARHPVLLPLPIQAGRTAVRQDGRRYP